MPVNIIFYTIKERKPRHHEEIIWLQNSSNFGSFGYTPREIKAEYHWDEIDQEGISTGNSICYDEGDKPIKNHKLEILFAGWPVEDDYLWCPTDEYWKYFDKKEEHG